MPLPTGRLMRIVLGGQADANNVWNIGFWWELQLASDGTINWNSIATDALGQFNSIFWNPASNPWKVNLASATGLGTCKVYGYDNGVLIGEGTASQTPVVGTNTSTCPPYTAAVFTLQSAAFGRSHRGRVYMPHTGPCGSGMQLNVSQAHVTNLGNFLKLQTFSGLNPAVALESQIVSRTHGTADFITQVRADTKADTQRGRQSRTVASAVYTASA